MAAQAGPSPVPSASARPTTSASSSTPAPTSAALQEAFDASLFYILTTWAPLQLAVQNSWAGALTADKRDWFVGAISTLFDERPDTDAYDVESVMLQVMADEFDVEVQDESEVPVAERIVEVRRRILLEGEVGVAEEVRRWWEGRRGGRVSIVDGGERVEEGSEGELEEEDQGEDVEMGDAPQLVPAQRRERVEPEIDEEGFTKVVGRKKR